MRQPFILYHDFKAGPCRIACFSDPHIGHPGHEATELAEDLAEAKEMKARIIILGDLNDLILQWDPRDSAARHSGRRDAVLNRAIRDTVETFAPVVDLIDMIAVGNHETAVLKHRSYDFVLGVIQELQKYRKSEQRIYHGGYRGFFRVQFNRGNFRRSQVWYYDHGRGGSAPVTKGMIDLARVMQDWDADVYWMGHKHKSISDDDAQRRYLTPDNKVGVRRRLAFFTAGYANGFVEHDYDEDGYILSYPEERFHGTSSSGNAIVRYEHARKRRDGIQHEFVRRYLDKAIAL